MNNNNDDSNNDGCAGKIWEDIIAFIVMIALINLFG